MYQGLSAGLKQGTSANQPLHVTVNLQFGFIFTKSEIVYCVVRIPASKFTIF